MGSLVQAHPEAQEDNHHKAVVLFFVRPMRWNDKTDWADFLIPKSQSPLILNSQLSILNLVVPYYLLPNYLLLNSRLLLPTIRLTSLLTANATSMLIGREMRNSCHIWIWG